MSAAVSKAQGYLLNEAFTDGATTEVELMPLINQTEPVALENLGSYLSRLGRLNNYDADSWYRPLLPPPGHNRIDRVRTAGQYRVLSQLTELTTEALYSLTLHHFAPRYLAPEALAAHDQYSGDIDMPLWPDRDLREYIHPRAELQLCPQCWAEGGVMLLPWSLRLVTSCPVHKVLLVDKCPACDSPLVLGSWSDVLDGVCSNCGYDLARIEPISLEGHRETEELTTLIWSAIGLADNVRAAGFVRTGEDITLAQTAGGRANSSIDGTEVPRDEATSNEEGARGARTIGSFPPASLNLQAAHPLHIMHSSTLLDYFRRMTLVLMRYDRDNPLFRESEAWEELYWHPLPPGRIAWKYRADVLTVHGALIAMWKLLRDWPTRWHETLDRIAQNEMRHSSRKRFPVLIAEEFPGARWAWLRAGIDSFLQQEARNRVHLYPWLPYYRTAQRAAGSVLVPLLSIREAARQLRMSDQTLRQYVREGKVRATPALGKERRREWRLVDAESLHELQAVQGELATLAQAANRLAIGEDSVVALVAAGLLNAERNPLTGTGTVWHFSRGELSQALERLTERLPWRSPKGVQGATQLPAALRLVSFQGVSLPQLLLATANKELAAYYGSGSSEETNDLRGLQLIWFDRAELLAWLKSRKQPEGQTLLTVQEVCEILSCKRETLQRLYEARLLVPSEDRTGRRGVRWRYDSQAVEAFRKRYVPTGVVAADLAVTPLTVQRWARAGRLPAVSGPGLDGAHSYLFDREAVSAWRKEHLTPAEAAQLLRVSRATLHRWVREEKLTPIPGMGGKQRWFSANALVRLLLGLDRDEGHDF